MKVILTLASFDGIGIFTKEYYSVGILQILLTINSVASAKLCVNCSENEKILTAKHFYRILTLTGLCTVEFYLEVCIGCTYQCCLFCNLFVQSENLN